jgi:hypothetical protein
MSVIENIISSLYITINGDITSDFTTSAWFTFLNNLGFGFSREETDKMFKNKVSAEKMDFERFKGIIMSNLTNGFPREEYLKPAFKTVEEKSFMSEEKVNNYINVLGDSAKRDKIISKLLEYGGVKKISDIDYNIYLKIYENKIKNIKLFYFLNSKNKKKKIKK